MRARARVEGEVWSDGVQHLLAGGGRFEEVLHGARELSTREDALEERLVRARARARARVRARATARFRARVRAKG